jgi:hypothetical protein
LPLEHLGWNFAVIAFSGICEGYSLRVAYREFRQSAGEEDDLWPAIQGSKDPSSFAILFEDSAALLGLLAAFLGIFFANLLKMPTLDGAASICIGLILVVTAMLMAAEIKGLLIGEGARSGTLKKICEMVQSDPAVERARRPLTMYWDRILSCWHWIFSSEKRSPPGRWPKRLIASSGQSASGIRGCATFISKRKLLFPHRGELLTSTWVRRRQSTSYLVEEE